MNAQKNPILPSILRATKELIKRDGFATVKGVSGRSGVSVSEVNYRWPAVCRILHLTASERLYPRDDWEGSREQPIDAYEAGWLGKRRG